MRYFLEFEADSPEEAQDVREAVLYHTPHMPEGLEVKPSGEVERAGRIAEAIVGDLARGLVQKALEGLALGRLWRHRKGGLYIEVGEARHSETLEPLMVYRSAETGELWARPLEMFRDGRFVEEEP